MRVKPQPARSNMDPEPKTAGRPHAPCTILARVMTERHIPVYRIATILHMSHRSVYNLLTRKTRVPVLHLAALCDYVDMDPEELVDAGNVLLEDLG